MAMGSALGFLPSSRAVPGAVQGGQPPTATGRVARPGRSRAREKGFTAQRRLAPDVHCVAFVDGLDALGVSLDLAGSALAFCAETQSLRQAACHATLAASTERSATSFTSGSGRGSVGNAAPLV